MNRALFLDRDGTLIVEKHYLHRPEEVEIIPGSAAALRELSGRGFLLFLVTIGLNGAQTLKGEIRNLLWNFMNGDQIGRAHV